jgi:hypothetical protein
MWVKNARIRWRMAKNKLVRRVESKKNVSLPRDGKESKNKNLFSFGIFCSSILNQYRFMP